jgi:[NiFe] hydrogenase diaphorase moiety large subunit
MLEHLESILARRRRDNLLGQNILGQAGFDFDIEIHLGAGAYVCGAEVAMIESLEGNRGVPRKRPPPFPVTHGYRGKPTVVNNVETLSHAALAMLIGGAEFATLGTAQSKGTKLLSVSGDCARPGIYEFPFGVTVRQVLDACGAHNVQAVQNSGPAGNCVAPAEFDRQLCFEDLNSTGSIMVFGTQRDLLEMVDNFAGFFVHESCGFCTPCRVGTSLMKQLVEKVRAGRGTGSDLKEMASLSSLIKNTSHCGLGLTATNHVSETLKKFPEIYENRLIHSPNPGQGDSAFAPFFDLDAALEDARQATRRNDAGAHF